MEKSYQEVERVETEQIPVYTFQAKDLKDVEVDGFSAVFDFGSEIVEIEGTAAELLSIKALIDKAASEARY